jgi:hypothetical protein
MHWKFTTGCPVTDGVVVNAEVVGGLCGVKVVGKFGHEIPLAKFVCKRCSPSSKPYSL